MPPKSSSPSESAVDREIVSARLFAAPREAVFEAFADPKQLAQWWGPSGFTNTIHQFEPKPGGRWRLTMRAPDGAAFENESVFMEVARPSRVVFKHLEPVHAFEMTMSFAGEARQTRLTWRMVFESAAECARVKSFILQANEQNFDRLQAHLAKSIASGAGEATADREIVITREFDAPRELVWQAMTDPKHVVNWWGPRGFTTTIEKMDVRPGGVWKHTMRGPDGASYPNKSVFKEIVRPERIVYSHGGGREDGRGAHFVASWTFEEVDPGRTSLTIRMVFPTTADRDFVVKEFGAVEGGEQTLARLAEYLAEVLGTAPKRNVVRITRSFTAPAEWVFNAWLQPARIGQWMFGAALRDEEVVNLKVDARVGGKFSFLVRRKGVEIDHVGSYRELERPRRLVFTWGIAGESVDESVVTVEIRGTGQGCDVTLTHELDPKWAEYAGRTEAGWTKMLDVLAESRRGQAAADAGGSQCGELFITRTFDAPRELVWKAWTDPKHLAQWWGPDGFTNPVCEIDVRPGGAISIHMRGPDGTIFPMTGQFREVIEPERLAFVSTVPDDSGKPIFEVLNTVTLVGEGARTTLTLTARVVHWTPAANRYLGGMEAGWTQSLERLGAHVAKS